MSLSGSYQQKIGIDSSDGMVKSVNKLLTSTTSTLIYDAKDKA